MSFSCPNFDMPLRTFQAQCSARYAERAGGVSLYNKLRFATSRTARPRQINALIARMLVPLVLLSFVTSLTRAETVSLTALDLTHLHVAAWSAPRVDKSFSGRPLLNRRADL